MKKLPIKALAVEQDGKCETCRWYRQTNFTGGLCHRFPPMTQWEKDAYNDMHLVTRYTMVEKENWCGEYQEVENGRQTKKHKTSTTEV